MASTNAIDYFAALGKRDGKFTPCNVENAFGDERGDMITPNQALSMVITDVAVVWSADETLPDETWELIDSSAGGSDLEYPRIAVRRWKNYSRTDYICDVIFIRTDDSAHPLGYNMISTSISGNNSAAITFSNGMSFFLAIRRFVNVSKTALLQGDSYIDDICVVEVDEDLPDNYIALKHHQSSITINMGSTDIGKSVGLGGGGGGGGGAKTKIVSIACHHQPPLGLCDIAFEYSTIDRYPKKDLKKGLELPVNELPMFAFPQGLQLTYNKKRDYPIPTFFTFVFTDVKGDHLYAACLKFYELVNPKEIVECLSMIYGPTNHDGVPWNFPIEFKDLDVFVPKIICVISRYPYYRAMKNFLKEVYTLSLSSLVCPIEYFLASTVNQLPLPIPGGRPFHLVLDAALISSSSKGLTPIVFKYPSSKTFPFMDLEFSSPFKCLTIDNITAIFCLMLREAKILFLCTSNTILTETMEILQSLLFPFTWSSSFISRLPDGLAGMMQAPGGFMIGVQTSASGDRQNSFQSIPSWKKTITPGTYIVDLNRNCISQFNGTIEDTLKADKIQQIIKTLPNSPRIRLIYRLQKCIEQFRIRPSARLESFDSAFDFQFDTEGKSGPKIFPSYEIRDAFLVFMVDILGEYQKYIKPPQRDLGQDTFRTFRESFEVDDFINDADVSMRSLLTSISETQMFSVLLQQRSEGGSGSYGLDLFERAVKVLRNVGLSARGIEANGNKQLLSTVPDLPIPLYKLTIAEEKWAGSTGKSLNSQAKNRSIIAPVYQSNSNPSTSPTADNSSNNPVSSSSSSPIGSSMTASFGNFFSSLSRGNSPIAASLGIKKEEKIINENLERLTQFITISEGSGYVFENQDDIMDDNDAFGNKLRRDEIDTSEDLKLLDRFKGPLLFQGPNKPDPDCFKSFVFAASKSKDGQPKINADGLFSYNNGWPQLDDNLIEMFHKNFNPKVVAVRLQRIETLDSVEKSVTNISRSLSERATHCYNSKLRSVLRGEMSTDSRLTSEHICAAIASVLDVISISLTMLSLRVSRKYKPTSDILQMLGILSQVETFNLVNYMDLATWRTIFFACSSSGGDMMRRIAFLSYDTLTSFLEPDCITFGEFNRAINSVKSHKFSQHNEDILDNYFFSEEIGNTWYIQREALNKNMNSSHISKQESEERGDAAATTRGRSISNVSSNGNSNSKSSSAAAMSFAQTVKKNKTLLKKTLSAWDASEKLGMHRPSGRFSFLKPDFFYSPLRPRQCTTDDDTNSSLFTAINSRYDKIYNLNISITPRVPPKQVMAANNNNKSPLSGPSNSRFTSDMGSFFSKMSSTFTSPVNSPQPINGNNSNNNVSSKDAEAEVLSAKKIKVVYKPLIKKSKFGLGINIILDEATSQVLINGLKVLPEDTPNPCLICNPPLRVGDRIIGVNSTACTEYNDVISNVKGSAESNIVLWIERSEEPRPPPQDFSDSDSDSEEDDEKEKEKENAKEKGGQNRDAGGTSDLLDLNSNIKVASTSNAANEPAESNLLNFDDISIAVSTSSRASTESNFAAENQSTTSPSSENTGGEATTDNSSALIVVSTNTSSNLLDFSESSTSITTLTSPAVNTDDASASASPGRSNTNDSSSSSSSSIDSADEVAAAIAIAAADVTGAAAEADFFSKTSLTPEKSQNSNSPVNSPVSGAPKTESDELIAWQKKIQEMQMTGFNCIIGLSSRNVCSCGFAMFDEEIMASWSRLAQSKDVSQFHNMINMNILHNITCLKCSNTIVPQLRVNCFTLDKSTDSVSTVWSINAPYYSPYGLRYELEASLEECGSSVIDADFLSARKPELLWGVIWYTNRLNLPTGFMPKNMKNSGLGNIGGIDFSKFFDVPVVTSWREEVARAKAGNLLRGTFEKSILPDIFPIDIQAELQEANSKIDEDMGLVSIKDAILIVGKAISRHLEAKSFEFFNQEISFERNLYCTMLSLCVINDKQRLLVHKHDDDIILSLSQKIDFDIKYNEAVRSLFSDGELALLKSTVKLLQSAIPSDGALTIRLGMGILL